jgi:hypothetical protein
LDAPSLSVALKRSRHEQLYELVSGKGEVDETAFHDMVSRNLKRGRFLLVIVGDGIREGVEGMAEFLQQHAGFHFTLAFVEIALFQAPGGYVAQPRVLARTTNIDRGIVTLDEGRIVISPPPVPPAGGNGSGRRTTITRERYFERLETEFHGISTQLNAFLDDLQGFNVRPEFGAESLILRWTPDNGKDWNLGTITKDGRLVLEITGWQAKNAGVLKHHKEYLAKLEKLVSGARIVKTPKENGWYVALDGRYITAAALVANKTRREGWVHAIAEFQAAVTKVSNDN